MKTETKIAVAVTGVFVAVNAYVLLRRYVAAVVSETVVSTIDREARAGSARAVALRPFSDLAALIARDALLKALPPVPLTEDWSNRR